jgi:hypothetical protein
MIISREIVLAVLEDSFIALPLIVIALKALVSVVRNQDQDSKRYY